MTFIKGYTFSHLVAVGEACFFAAGRKHVQTENLQGSSSMKQVRFDSQ